jgi:hypothetical protein
MNPARLVFQEGACDGNLLLPAREDFATGQIEGGIFSMASRITQQAGFTFGSAEAVTGGYIMAWL